VGIVLDDARASSGSIPWRTLHNLETVWGLVRFGALTAQITGGKKQSEERAALFAVRVHLPC
jgi:hypothetical protein